jgi:hypothetical protein
MNSDSQIIILCEDTAHYHFARRYFQLLGFNGHKIKSKHNSKGISSGSGAEFVKNHYEEEVQVFRSKSKYLNYILVVIIDDDTKSRIQNLYDIYKPARHERILIFSPNRNIESWIRYIDTGDFNVENNKDEKGQIKNYKSQYGKNCKYTEFAENLKKICDGGLPENAPSSLHHACNELNRLKL